MASKSLGTLVVDLIANTSKFTEGMSKAERQSENLENAQKRLGREAFALERKYDPLSAKIRTVNTDLAKLKAQYEKGSISLSQYNKMTGAAKEELDKLEKASRGLSGVQRRVQGLQEGFTKFIGPLKAVAAGVAAVSAAAVAGGTALTVLTQRAAENARDIQTLAQVANTSTENLQRMAYASAQVNVEQEKLADILKDVNDRVGDFIQTGGGPMADFFENIAPKVGVTAEQFRNLSGPDALQLYYDSLEKANLSQADMVFYMEAMANDATRLIPLLKNGGERFAEMADEADRFGLVLSELQIDQLVEFGNQFNRIKEILSALTNVFAAELAPILTVVSNRMLDAAGSSESFGQTVRTAMESGAIAVAKVIDVINRLRLANAQVEIGVAHIQKAFGQMAIGAIEAVAKVVNYSMAPLNALGRAFAFATGQDFEPIQIFSDADFGNLKDAEKALDSLLERKKDNEAYLRGQGLAEDWVRGIFDEVDAQRNLIAGRRDFKSLTDWMFPDTTSSGGGGGGGSSPKPGPKDKGSGPLNIYDEMLGEVNESLRETKTLGQEVGESLSQTFSRAIQGGQDFKSVLADIAANIADIVVRRKVIDPFSNAFSGFINDAFAPRAPGGFFGQAHLVGQAHDGIMSVPQSGTWNLQKGERVLPQDTAAKMDQALSSMSRGGINVEINDYSTGDKSYQTEEVTGADGAKKIRVMIRDEVKSAMNNGSLDSSMSNNYGIKRRAL